MKTYEDIIKEIGEIGYPNDSKIYESILNEFEETFVGTAKELREGWINAKECAKNAMKKAQDEYWETFDNKMQELKNSLKEEYGISQDKFNIVWAKACDCGDNLNERVDNFYELMELIDSFNNCN